ncbi:hypothetical protein L6R53_29475 [Myxococcota bacterium]|nr:hypothetical protein [Myxococcota bacterium]
MTFTVSPTTVEGTPCVTCPPEVALNFRASMENTCKEPVRVTTTTNCLVSRFVLTSVSGPPQESNPPCKDGFRDWILEPGGRENATWAYGELAEGAYTIEARFDDEGGHLATQRFSVALPK